ncbi:MAG: glucosidase, partial [Chloroflexota bacterium]
MIFTENETNNERLFGAPNKTPYVKDAFHSYVINRRKESVNPKQTGTKSAAVYHRTVGTGESVSVRLRLMKVSQVETKDDAFSSFDEIFAKRQSEADE